MAIAEYYLGLTIEGDESPPKLTIDGRRFDVTKIDDLFLVSGHPEIKANNLYELGQQIIDGSQEFQKKLAIRDTHVEILRNGGVPHWNAWRREDPATRPLLFGADLRQETLGLSDLNSVDFANANLIDADLRNTSLIEANFHEANLGGAKLHHAILTRANFCRTDLYKTNMTEARLIEANLQGAQLAGTVFKGAKLIRCKVYGMSAWDLDDLKDSVQEDLIIRYRQKGDSENDKGIEAHLWVGDLQVAQFMYMLLNNENLRPFINAATSRIVLILGRFMPQERKDVLNAIRNALRGRFVPIQFDFAPPDRRDLTETIQLLASLARFVVADLTDAKSVPQELSRIVPNLPSVPVQPILLASQKENVYALFDHWRRFPWVLPEFLYENQTHLMDHLEEKVISPAIEWMSPEASLTNAMLEIEELKKQLAKLQTDTHQEGSAASTS